MNVKARCFDALAGRIVEQVVEAPSLAAATQRLQASGAVVLSVSTEAPSAGDSARASAFSRFDAAAWCTELRVLLAAGMTVVEAIDTLLAQSAGAGSGATSSSHQLNAALHHQLQQGTSLSQAMANTGAFADVLLAGVVAGERSGALIEALDEYLRFHSLISGMKRQLQSAALYPVLVLGVGALIMLFLLLFVMPRFGAIYADMPQAAGGLTAAVLGLSRLLSAHGPLVAAAGVLAAALWWWWWRSGGLARAAYALSEAVPALRERVDEFRKAQLFQALALMFKGGYTLDDALARAAAMGLGPRMAQSVLLAHQQVLAGCSPAQALQAAGLLDEVSLRLVRVGERAGHFERVLGTIAERHGQRFTTTVQRLTRVAEPLMLLIVALAVGSLVVLMYIPVFDIAGSVR